MKNYYATSSTREADNKAKALELKARIKEVEAKHLAAIDELYSKVPEGIDVMSHYGNVELKAIVQSTTQELNQLWQDLNDIRSKMLTIV